MIPVRLDTLMTVVCTTAAVVPMIAISACLMPASVQFAMPPPISEPQTTPLVDVFPFLNTMMTVPTTLQLNRVTQAVKIVLVPLPIALRALMELS